MNQATKALIAALLMSGSSHLLAVAGDEDGNFLVNADFDHGLQDWTFNISSAVTWVANYDSPPPGTTSLGAVALFQEGSENTNASQCVQVVSGQKYVASVWAIATCSANARIGVDWYGDAGCAVTFIGNADMSSEKSSNDWQKIQSTVLAPDTAQSAHVIIENEGHCNDAVLFDGAFFGDRIFSNSFE